MAGFCIPKYATEAFLEKLRTGEIDPQKLAEMTSAERRAVFSDIVGEGNAKQVNALFETKLLLKNQQAAMINWAKQIAGLKPEAQRDLIARVNRMSEALTPENEDKFYEDFAAHRLGVDVTPSEAAQIVEMAKKTSSAQEAMQNTPAGSEERIAYGRSLMDFNEYIESLKPDNRTFSQKLVDIANIPKTALTSVLHLSAPFVQGWGMMSTKVAWQGFGEMLKYFASEEHYKNLDAYILSHPDYVLAKDGKLGITHLGDKLTQREEAIQSSLVEKFNTYASDKTGLPNLVRASSRGFAGYLNYIRFNRFTQLLDAARLNGEDVRKGQPVVRDIAKVVNDFTGRGALGKGDRYGNAAPALNALFFSPRKISATMEMFDPVRYLDPKISSTARQAALKQLLGSVLATSAVLTVARAMGAEVNHDPRSTDFAKIKIGGEKLDMTGGNAIYLRLLARLATNQDINSKGKLTQLGKGYKPKTRADEFTAYVRGKLSPLAAAVADWMYGTDQAGQPFSATSEAYNKLTPIVMQDFINLAMNDPQNTAAYIPALSAIFGVGLESPTPKVKKR